MAFTVFSIASVPDTVTARRLFDLQDLDDKAVSKVLFHRRKQQTGFTEALRWDQRALAGITLIRCSADRLDMRSLGLGCHTETEMLEAYYEAATGSNLLVSWDGVLAALPLLHFRSLQAGLCQTTYWQSLAGEGSGFHVDLRQQLCPASDDVPTLDAVARSMDLPGASAVGEKELYDGWLAGDDNPVRAFTDLAALQLFLLSVRWQRMTGTFGRQDVSRAEDLLRESLQHEDQPHLREFLADWSDGQC
jgi:hypothetical protein